MSIDTFKLAELVAPFLEGWRFNRVLSEPSGWRPKAIFTNDDRYQFTMQPYWQNESRVVIRGAHSRHEITASPERPPQHIAGDIERRFLPQYMADLSEYLAREKQREEEATELALKLNLFEQVLGPFRNDHGYRKATDYHFDGGSISFRYDGRIDLTLNLSYDDAIRVAQHRDPNTRRT
jgi:hypothetical protein